MKSHNDIPLSVRRRRLRTTPVLTDSHPRCGRRRRRSAGTAALQACRLSASVSRSLRTCLRRMGLAEGSLWCSGNRQSAALPGTLGAIMVMLRWHTPHVPPLSHARQAIHRGHGRTGLTESPYADDCATSRPTGRSPGAAGDHLNQALARDNHPCAPRTRTTNPLRVTAGGLRLGGYCPGRLHAWVRLTTGTPGWGSARSPCTAATTGQHWTCGNGCPLIPFFP